MSWQKRRVLVLRSNSSESSRWFLSTSQRFKPAHAATFVKDLRATSESIVSRCRWHLTEFEWRIFSDRKLRSHERKVKAGSSSLITKTNAETFQLNSAEEGSLYNQFIKHFECNCVTFKAINHKWNFTRKASSAFSELPRDYHMHI